jgi:hypothetical protein
VRATFFLLCEYVVRLENGSPSLIGIFHGSGADSYPRSLPPGFLAFELEAEPDETERPWDFRIVFMDYDGRTLMEYEAQALFHRSEDLLPSRFWHALPLQGPPFIEKPGVYRFDMLVEGEVIASTRLVCH